MNLQLLIDTLILLSGVAFAFLFYCVKREQIALIFCGIAALTTFSAAALTLFKMIYGLC